MTVRPQECLLRVAVHPLRKEDNALNISVIVKLVTTGRTANSFVTSNERSLFGRMRPFHDTLDACDQSAAWGSLSYVTRALVKFKVWNLNFGWIGQYWFPGHMKHLHCDVFWVSESYCSIVLHPVTSNPRFVKHTQWNVAVLWKKNNPKINIPHRIAQLHVGRLYRKWAKSNPYKGCNENNISIHI